MSFEFELRYNGIYKWEIHFAKYLQNTQQRMREIQAVVCKVEIIRQIHQLLSQSQRLLTLSLSLTHAHTENTHTTTKCALIDKWTERSVGD